MLGSQRFFLALFVVVAHLTGGVQFFSHWGGFAVFGFYIISGYLITLILNETYHFRLSEFSLNRFLRLFPIYYIVAAITILTITISSNASDFHPAWKIQTRWIDIIGNGLIIPFEFYNASFRIVPPTWSVAVELINYLILWAMGARSRALAVLLFLIALDFNDWTPFFQSWELYGKYPAILSDEVVGEQATNLFEDAQKMLQQIVSEKWLTAKGIVGIFPANTINDDDIAVYTEPETRNSQLATFLTLRQQSQKTAGAPNIALWQRDKECIKLETNKNESKSNT